MGSRSLWPASFALAAVIAGSVPSVAQTPKPRLWLAGRYDGNRIIVFFDAVKFGGAVPRTARALPIPATFGFLFQDELPANYVAQFTRKAGVEQFRVGDRYDLLLGDGRVATATITTLVGYVSDDEGDDPSYIGALARVDGATTLLGTRGYYVLERHDSSAEALREPGKAASLVEDPVRFDVQTQIAALLSERVGNAATAEEQRQIKDIAPMLAVQAFRLADGELRYYARVEWRADNRLGGIPVLAMGAWIAPHPNLHIVAIERITSPYAFPDDVPSLLNVIDLGGGETGIIADITGPGDNTLGLWEYQDGVDLNHMHLFQSLVMDE
ncbi:MAG TPA: hypothetical protein VMF91_23055 [Bryobacteraceae bacterium]|nr:hypothetical protein [Bryobacteraceae bacterium]